MPIKYTTEIFTEKAALVHNNLYDYNKVNYINMHTKVCIIDPNYGEFWQAPVGHVNGQGHPERGKLKSANKRKIGKEEFIKRATKRHGKLYDYSKVEYTHTDHKVCIIDPNYGEFWQSPYQHLNSHGNPERTVKKEWYVHLDHILPLSLVHHGYRSHNKWFKDRPLYKFLDSDINKEDICALKNRTKSDLITIKGKEINCGSVRNNYDVIHYLIQEVLNINATDIILADKKFILEYFNI